MSNTKKYLMLASGVVLLIWGGLCAYFALSHITDLAKVAELTNWVSSNFGDVAYETAKLTAQMIVAFLASSAIVSVAFGAFTLRFSFYEPAEFEEKRSISITMAILSFIVVNPIVGGLFLAAALLPDKNYVAPKPVTPVDEMEEKLRKLNVLKEKNLISEEEYTKLRNNILESSK